MYQRDKQALSVKILHWPTPQEYNEAVQNISTAFDDPDLKGGQPVLNQFGLPQPISGAFASVYRVKCEQRDWALRCFLHNFADQRERYARISTKLKFESLRYMVAFDFLENGVNMHGQWYPILKMAWAEGLQLSQYVELNVHDQSALVTLSEKWKQMILELRQVGIAHGDLQHGNVLVCGQDLRLVDYDGMYVPALAGTESNELGHRNYQHPARSKTDFGAYLDNFAAWVVYISLRCLSIDAGLWQELNGGDECLLFRQRDFVNPLGSRAFFRLEHHASMEIRTMAHYLRFLLTLPVSQVPVLGSTLAVPVQLPELDLPIPISISDGSGLPDWMRADGKIDSTGSVGGRNRRGKKARGEARKARRAAARAAMTPGGKQTGVGPGIGMMSTNSATNNAVRSPQSASGVQPQPKFELPNFAEPSKFGYLDRVWSRVFDWQSRHRGLASLVSFAVLLLLIFAGSHTVSQLPVQTAITERAPPQVVQSINEYSRADLTSRQYLGGASIFLNEGNYAKAADLYRKALQALEKEGERGTITYANSLAGLASCYAELSHFREAEQSYRKALSSFEQIKGADSEEAANVLTALGALCQRDERPQLANSLYKRVLKIDEKVFGRTDPRTAATLEKLADCSMTLRNYRSARQQLARAWTIYESHPLADQQERIESLTHLRDLYRRLGDKANVRSLEGQIKKINDSISAVQPK